MGDLANLTPGTTDNTYKDLLHFEDAGMGIQASLKKIQDGSGNDTGIELSTTHFKYTGVLSLESLTADTFPYLNSSKQLISSNISWDSGSKLFLINDNDIDFLNDTNNRTIAVGSPTVVGTGSALFIEAGEGLSGLFGAAGGDLHLKAGAGGTGTTNGGNVYLDGGNGTTKGDVYIGHNIDHKIFLKGDIEFEGWGSGTHSGTATYALAVDSSGNVIEISTGGGGGLTIGTTAISSGTAGRVLYEDGSNLLGESGEFIYNTHGVSIQKSLIASADYGSINIGNGGFAGGGSNFAGNSNGTSLVVYEPTGYAGEFINIGSADVAGLRMDSNANLGLNIAPSASDTVSNRIFHIRQSAAVGLKLQTNSTSFEIYNLASRGLGVYDITNGAYRLTLLNNGHFQINNNTDLGSIFGITGLPTSNSGLSAGAVYVDTAANILSNGDKIMAVKQ